MSKMGCLGLERNGRYKKEHKMIKDTKGKLRLNLVPNCGLEAVARVREFGNKKYPGNPDSYVTEVSVDDLVEAARRHLLKYRKGELLDEESSEMHLAHGATSLMMAIEILYRNMEVHNLSLRETQRIVKKEYKDSRRN